jgi:hypothetical protein
MCNLSQAIFLVFFKLPSLWLFRLLSLLSSFLSFLGAIYVLLSLHFKYVLNFFPHVLSISNLVVTFCNISHNYLDLYYEVVDSNTTIYNNVLLVSKFNIFIIKYCKWKDFTMKLIQMKFLQWNLRKSFNSSKKIGNDIPISIQINNYLLQTFVYYF